MACKVPAEVLSTQHAGHCLATSCGCCSRAHQFAGRFTVLRALTRCNAGLAAQVPGDAEIMIQTLARERPPPAPMPPTDFALDVDAILAATGSSSSTPPVKTLSGVPSSPICALDTPFGSSGSEASSALSRRWSLDRAGSSVAGSSVGGASPSPPSSWGGRAVRSGSRGSAGRGSASGSGGAWGRRVVDFFTSCSDPRSAGETS